MNEKLTIMLILVLCLILWYDIYHGNWLAGQINENMLHYANASTTRYYPDQDWINDCISHQENMSGDGSLGSDIKGPAPGGPAGGDADGSGSVPTKYNPFITYSDAESIQMPNGGYTILNPYLLPYSESDCMDSYADSSIPAINVQSLNAPDHLIMTN